MNILHLTTHLNAGGITSYLNTLVGGIRRAGHNVLLVSSGGECEEAFKDLGVDVVNLNMRTKSELDPRIYLALIKLSGLIDRYKIDCIHAHTRISQVMAHLLSSIKRVPYCTTCHGFFRPRIFRKLFPCWGHRVIAISEAVEDHLTKDFQVPKDRVRLVTSGVDSTQFSELSDGEKDELRQKLGITKDYCIGIIARLSDVKGIDILIKAMPLVIEQINDVQLVIVGEGREQGALNNLVENLKLKEQVLFIPTVNKTAEILPVFDVFCMPSRSEGLGLSVMEAQAAGLPVIASGVGGIPSLIEDEKTGVLVEPENSRQLADAIVGLYKDRAFARKLGISGKEFIRKDYSVEKMVDSTVEVYREMIG